MDERIPRQLPERTGRHRCIVCLGETPAEVYFRNDHVCDECAAKEEYPLATTPDAKKKHGAKKSEGKR